MADVQKKMFQTRLPISALANYLQEQDDAIDLVDSPPRYIQDLFDHLKREDDEGWTEVKDARRQKSDQHEEPRTFFSVWINGEDLNVFNAMMSAQLPDPTQPLISVSVEPAYQQFETSRSERQLSKKTEKSTTQRKRIQLSDAQRNTMNRFAFLGVEASQLTTTCDPYSDSDDDYSSDVSVDPIDVGRDFRDADVNIEEPEAKGMVFYQPAAFRSKYGYDVPVTSGLVRSLEALRDNHDHWRMNLEERTRLYHYWQQSAIDMEAGQCAVKFSQLREEHAALLSEMDDYRDQVRRILSLSNFARC